MAKIHSQRTGLRFFMSSEMTATALLVLATLLAAPTLAAAPVPSASCNVEVNYVVNGELTESYAKDFVVAVGDSFVDDFSSPTREKRFTATLTREAGKLVVSMDYFNDVGVFVAIGLDASVRLRGPGVIESTAGGYTFSSSQAIPPGNHTTNYTLVCHRD